MASHGVPRSSAPVARSEQARQKELKTIEEYKSLVDLVNSKITERQYTAEVLNLTSQLLTWNPEYYTIWNHRRIILRDGLFPSSPASQSGSVPSLDQSLAEYEQNTLDIIRSDLRFLISPLRKFPKCYWIWNHRLWLLQEAKERTPVHASRELWRSELGLVGKMLVLDSRNFHGWSYRRIVASQLESPGKDAGPNGYPEDGFKGFSMVEEEFAYSTKMIQSNLSNFSAWHYRGKLAPRLLSERTADGEARRAFLKEEFEIILSALYTDPDNQSLWSYHEWLMSNHLKDLAGPAIIIDFSDAEKEAGISTELANIRELLEVEDGCKCIYEALIRYTLMTRTSPDASQRDPDGELRGWLRALERLDPLRRGRWEDLKASLE